ncbi:MAG TPA: diguanylate cyclase, partial [Rhizomicrobium sp.]
MRLALAGARAATFDWTIADDHIVWDGATDILSMHPDSDRLQKGDAFRAWMNPESRQKLGGVIETPSPGDATFDLEFEAASAMGSVWFMMRGVRVADAAGRAERLTGSLRVITEEKRSMQRLVYLATRDELTGHLNRNALRGELAQAIEAARAEGRTCAFLVASIDRLAMINDAYGFDAADEVIVAVGERIAR